VKAQNLRRWTTFSVADLLYAGETDPAERTSKSELAVRQSPTSFELIAILTSPVKTAKSNPYRGEPHD
jgi:hypothetical protein